MPIQQAPSPAEAMAGRQDEQNITKRLIVWAAIVALLLLIPLVLTIRDGGIEGVGWNWTLSNFVFMGTLLFEVKPTV